MLWYLIVSSHVAGCLSSWFF